MVDVTNKAVGMRGVNTKAGTQMILPGQTLRGVEFLSEADERIARQNPDFAFDDAPEGTRLMGFGEQPEIEEGEQPPNALYAEDQSRTAIPAVAATLHPMPPGQDPTKPEMPMEGGAIVAPWASGGGVGSADQGKATEPPEGFTNPNVVSAPLQPAAGSVMRSPADQKAADEEAGKRARAPKAKE